jgi:N-acetylneuraminic acid mutarotase
MNMWASYADEWIQKSDFGGTSRGNAIGFSIGDKGYIGTGSSYNKDFWEYDPVTDTWTQKADLPGSGRAWAVGFVIGSKGYVGTGKDSDSMPIDDFWEFDPETNSWLKKSNFPGGIRWNAFAFALDGKGYVGAGQGKGSWKQDFWEYDPGTDTWMQKANYGGGKVGGAVAFTIADDKGYAGTGRDTNLDYRKDFWEYDPATDVWTQKADFAGGERTGGVAFSIGSFGYAGMGIALETSFTDFWQYDPSFDQWTQKADYIGDAFDTGTGFSIDNFGYTGTGGTNGKQFYQYIPDCLTPTGLHTVNIKATSAKVSWAVEPSAETYIVRYRKTGTMPWTKTTALSNFKKLAGLVPDAQYDWSVKSVCDAANNISSGWSATQTFHTKPLKLEGPDEEAMSFAVYPNPFSTSATISFSMQEDAAVTIELFNLSGRKVETLLDEYAKAGDHVILLNAWALRRGICLLRMKMNDQTSVMKIVIQ